jgi:hypothetical protein
MSGVLQPIRRMPPHYRGIRRYQLVNEADGLALGPLSSCCPAQRRWGFPQGPSRHAPHPQGVIGTACRTGARTTSASGLAGDDVIFGSGGRSAWRSIRASPAPG